MITKTSRIGSITVFETPGEIAQELKMSVNDIKKLCDNKKTNHLIKVVTFKTKIYGSVMRLYYIQYTELVNGKRKTVRAYTTGVDANMKPEGYSPNCHLKPSPFQWSYDQVQLNSLFHEYYMEARDDDTLEPILQQLKVGDIIYQASGTKVKPRKITSIDLRRETTLQSNGRMNVAITPNCSTPSDPSGLTGIIVCGINKHGGLITPYSSATYTTNKETAKLVILEKLRKQISKQRTSLTKLMTTFKKVSEM